MPAAGRERGLSPALATAVVVACLASGTAGAAHAAVAAARSAACHAETYSEVDYTVCTFDLAATDLRVFWRQSDGSAYRTFDALDRDLAREGLGLAFAINGGMF